jgi:hypothetical protein
MDKKTIWKIRLLPEHALEIKGFAEANEVIQRVKNKT